MISNLDIEVEVARAHAAREFFADAGRWPTKGDDVGFNVDEARYWINLIDRVRYDAEQTLDGQIEERPF